MAIAENSNSVFDAVFGSDSVGESPEERAQSSSQEFVRSQIQVALDNPRAKGRRLSAMEALDIFGWSILSELAFNDAVPIVMFENEPGLTLRKRREQLGLTVEQLSNVAKIKCETISSLESGKKAIPIRDIENIARHLSLDENQLGLQPTSGADASLGVRLRELLGDQNASHKKFPASLVSVLSEAAWVIKKQADLQKKNMRGNNRGARQLGITPSSDFNYPAWKQGLLLANKTRQILKLDPEAPIDNLKELVEKTLLIPVVQADLPPRFAGATIAIGGQARGIVLNLKGANSNVWIRRNTLAHELGHLLWDPLEYLNKLRVDEFADLDADPFSPNKGAKDPVEIRANAFAVEFLAPQAAVKSLFSKADSHESGLRDVILTYGISFTAARWQVANALNIKPSDLKVEGLDVQPTDAWLGKENYTADYFPIESVPISRRGRFVRVLLDAMEQKHISLDTVASCLGASSGEIKKALPTIKQLFD